MAENSSPNGTWVTGAGCSGCKRREPPRRRRQRHRKNAAKLTASPSLRIAGGRRGVSNDRITDRYHMAFWQIYSRDSQAFGASGTISDVGSVSRVKIWDRRVCFAHFAQAMQFGRTGWRNYGKHHQERIGGAAPKRRVELNVNGQSSIGRAANVTPVLPDLPFRGAAATG
jgi:hypothetical protein